MSAQKKIRITLGCFMAALIISGITAMPVETELRFLLRTMQQDTRVYHFLEYLYTGVTDAKNQYPFLFYGLDWLAFAHFVIAIAFIGPYRDPVKNKWVIEFGMIACILLVPFALVAGGIREMPMYWRLIDCSFGILGMLPLYYCYRKVKEIENINI